MTAFKQEHREWVDKFLKQLNGGAPATAGPGVLMAGPGEPGFGNNPHAVETPKDAKEKLPDKPGMVATSEGHLVKSVPPTTDVNKSFNDFTTKLVQHDQAATALRAKLDGLDKQEKQVQDFIQANSKNLESEVSANQSDAIKNVARDMEQEREHFDLVGTVLSSLKLNIEDAKSRLDSAQLKLNSIQNLDEARRLSEKVQQQSQKVDTAISLIGNVIELGVAIGKEDPAAAIKPIWDAITTIGKLNKDNPLAKEAEQHRSTGTNQALQAANIDIDAALKIINEAAILAENTEKQQRRGFDHYVEMRDDVESLYDGSAKGKFKFGDLVKHLKWTDSSATLGVQTYEEYERAYFLADGLRDIYRAVMNQMQPPGQEFGDAVLVLKQLAIVHAKGKSATRAKLQQFAKLRDSLTAMRDTATQKLAHAPVPRSRPK